MMDEQLPFGDYLDFGELSRDEMQSKLLELLTLVETSREMLRANDSEDMARRVLLSAIGVLGASSACVLQRDPERPDRLTLLHQFGLDVEPPVDFAFDEELALRLENRPTSRPFRVDRQHVRGEAASFLDSNAAAVEATEAVIVCPLMGRRGLFGFFVLGRRLLAEGYSARDLELFASLAELYTLALERAASPAPIVRPKLREEPRQPIIASANELETRRQLAQLRSEHPALRDILGESPELLKLFHDLAAFADSRATILIQGESGTGKELIAQAIHGMSRRETKPLEIVDCSSIPRELIESELFGHMRGAFTGAVRDRRGAFELAHSGTLFLDEIGEMTLASQTRLLRVLQEGKFRPVGGEKTLSVDVRFIAATNVDLNVAVREGRFRKDLFYRIQVFPLRLPPLRERRGDIEILTRAFLRGFYADEGLEVPKIEPALIEKIIRHDFPGNVRELQHMVEALAIRSRGDDAVRAWHLEEVWRSQRIADRPTIVRSTGDAERTGDAGKARATLNPPQQNVLPTGELLRRTWQDAGFNLLEASRQLRARRSEGEKIAVVDRAQLSHYLDGEILSAFLEAGEMALCVEKLAAGRRHAHRAAKRAERVMNEALEAMESGEDAFPRLPEEYRDELDKLRKLGPNWLRARLQIEDGSSAA